MKSHPLTAGFLIHRPHAYLPIKERDEVVPTAITGAEMLLLTVHINKALVFGMIVIHSPLMDVLAFSLLSLHTCITFFLSPSALEVLA